jgi:DNA-binding SARP family transcriptional activator
MYELRTLGPLELKSADGSDIPNLLAGPKRLGLLVYLILATPNGFLRRDTLCAVFWPGLDPKRARGSLRNMLHALRRDLGSEVFLTRGNEEIGIDQESLRCDAIEFEKALAAGRRAEALRLYRGALLPGLFIPNASPDFDHWLDAERMRYQRRAAEAAVALTESAEADGDVAAAIRWARRAVSISPDDEPTLRQLLTLMDRAGDRAGALRAFDAFERRLADELAMEPADETRALALEIRSRAPVPEGEADPPGAQPEPIPSRQAERATPAAHAPPVASAGSVPRADPAETMTLPWANRPPPAPDRRRRLAGLAGSLLAVAAIIAWIGGQFRADRADSDASGAAVAEAGPASEVPAWSEDGALGEARAAFEKGAADRAEALYREALEADRRSVEGWLGLGEVLFHHGPIRGEPIGNARVAFEHVLAFEPGHVGARWYLARIAASERDSAAVTALTNTLLERVADAERRLEIEALAAFTVGDEAARHEVLRRLAASRSGSVLNSARLVAVHAHEWTGAERILALLAHPTRPREMQAIGQVLSAHLALAAGRRAAALEALEAAEALVPGWGLPYLAMVARVPFAPGSEAELRALEERLRAWDVNAATPLGQGDPFHDGDRRTEVRTYLLGAIGLQRGDAGAASAVADGLDRNADGGGPNARLIRDLRARSLRLNGDDEAAIETLRGEETIAAPGPLNLGAWNRFLKADLLAAAGHDEEATAWYSSFADGRLRDLAYLAPSYLRRAEIHDRAGDAARAMRYYARFAKLWSDCDPGLRPTVDRAERRLAELRRERADQPAEHGLDATVEG